MPIPLPPPINDHNVIIPQAPDTPPTLLDVTRSWKYVKDVAISTEHHGINRATNEDLGQALIFQHTVTHAVSAAAGPNIAPPWFAPALAPFQQQLNAMQLQLGRMELRLVKLTNANRGDGSVVNFDTVPFLDGTDPTQVGLPALISVAAINDLSRAHSTRYLNGYGVAVPAGGAQQEERQRLLRICVGCLTNV